MESSAHTESYNDSVFKCIAWLDCHMPLVFHPKGPYYDEKREVTFTYEK